MIGRRSIAKTVLLLAIAVSAGCATVIIPPGRVQTPADVYVLDYGRTSAVVIPNANGGMTRYAYGDWAWYAQRKTGVFHAMAALLWPTPSALGRQDLSADEANPLRLARGVENLYTLTVDRDKAIEVSRKLDRYFAGATILHQPDVSFDFVKYPDSYTVLHNSNHFTAHLLNEMGARTRGWPVYSVWSVSGNR